MISKKNFPQKNNDFTNILGYKANNLMKNFIYQ